MVQRIQYTSTRQLMEQELAAMYQDLKNYQLRDNAKPEYIEKQERRISIFMAFLRSSDGAILEAEEERQQAFYKGMEKGRRESRQEFSRWDPHDKEMFRAQTINRARQTWPDLFQPEI